MSKIRVERNDFIVLGGSDIEEARSSDGSGFDEFSELSYDDASESDAQDMSSDPDFKPDEEPDHDDERCNRKNQENEKCHGLRGGLLKELPSNPDLLFAWLGKIFKAAEKRQADEAANIGYRQPSLDRAAELLRTAVADIPHHRHYFGVTFGYKRRIVLCS